MHRNDNPDSMVPKLEDSLRSLGFIGTWDWEVASGMMVFDNAMALLLFGDETLAGKRLPGKTTPSRIHPDDVSWLGMRVADAVRSAGLVDVEYRVQEPGGSERKIRAIGHVYGLVEGELVGVRGITLSAEMPSALRRDGGTQPDTLAECVDRLIEARQLSQFGLLTRLIDMALLEAGRRLAGGMARERREALT